MEGKKIEEVRKSLPAEVDRCMIMKLNYAFSRLVPIFIYIFRRVPTLSKDASSVSVSSN